MQVEKAETNQKEWWGIDEIVYYFPSWEEIRALYDKHKNHKHPCCSALADLEQIHMIKTRKKQNTLANTKKVRKERILNSDRKGVFLNSS